MTDADLDAEVIARRKVLRTRVMREAAEQGFWLTHRTLDGGERELDVASRRRRQAANLVSDSA